MTRTSVLFAGLALLLVAIASLGALVYAMNASYSVADSAHEAYYVHYSSVWGLVTIASLGASLGCGIVAWRARRR